MKIILSTLLILTAVVPAFSRVQQTINRGNGAEPDSLNIHQAQGINSHNILMDMYEGLVTLDAAATIVPGVASSYQVSEDQTQWHFLLRPEAKWSDGSPLLASHFIKAWQQAIDPATAAPYRHLFTNLMQAGQLMVKSPSAHELIIHLREPDSSLLQKLSLPVFYPLPTTVHSVSDHTVSNGAYHLVEWHLQEHITLAKNPYFHASDSVQTSQIKYWVTENQHSELLKFRAKELDITETIPDSQINWLQEHLPNELRIAPYYGTFFLGLNLADQHLKDLKLRQALSWSIDRTILTQKVLKSGQIAATQIIPQATQSSTVNPGFDLKLAQQLLKESPFNPTGNTLEILYNNSDNQKKVALAVAAMWRQNLGIKTKLKHVEWKVFVNTRKGPNKQIFRSGWIADYHDPTDFLNLFHSQSHFNFYAFNNQQYDALLAQLQRPNQDRMGLFKQAESILQQQLPVIPLYHYVSRHLVQTHVSGFIDNDMDRHLSRYLASNQPN